ELVGAPITLFRSLELAPQAVDLGFLVEGVRLSFLVDRLGATLESALGFFDGVAPCSADLQDFRPVDPTRAAERNELRLPVAPAGERRRPLPRAIEGVDELTARQHAAVDQAGDGRREIAAGGGDHRFVEKGEARIDAPRSQERAALLGAREGDQV